MTNNETRSPGRDDDFPTVRRIEEPFEEGTGEWKLYEVVSRMQGDHCGPEYLVLQAIAVLKEFAAQHVEDLDQLTADVAETWSGVERHHHTARLRVFHITEQERNRDYILEQMERGWFLGKDLSPIRDRRPDIWAAWEERERLLEAKFGDLRRKWAKNRQNQPSAGSPAPDHRGDGH